MVLLYSSYPSNCATSSQLRSDASSSPISSDSSTLFAAPPAPPTPNNLSQYPYRSLPIQFRLDELGTEMESEDDDCSESSSVTSDGASSFDSSSVCSITNELDSLNERRREMLHVSISKIQTMNASHVAVSLRKSLLIYNTMKSLQRDLEESGEDVYGSLIERNETCGNFDEELMSTDDLEQCYEDWTTGNNNNQQQEQQQGMFPLCRERDNLLWAWSNNNDLQFDSNNDAFQDLDHCGGGLVMTNGNNELLKTGSGGEQHTIRDGCDLWAEAVKSTNTNTGNSGGVIATDNCCMQQSLFIDDYLGMWGACADEDYNPLNNCNLSQSDILHMFGPPSQHIVSNELVSQA